MQHMDRLAARPPCKNDVFCTMLYFRRHTPGRAYSLDAMASYFGTTKLLAARHVHGALLDAEILASVLPRMSQIPKQTNQ